MPWYLRHFFDPDFDHTALKPRPLARGRCDMRNLGYARNVLPGQVFCRQVFKLCIHTRPRFQI